MRLRRKRPSCTILSLVGYARATERIVLGSEVWQFLIILLGFLVAAVLWLFVVYLPGRTLERWEGNKRPDRDKAGPSKPL
jgi:hypothetical protein